MKRHLPIFTVVAAAVMLAGLCLRAFSDPVPMERLNRLRMGMTQHEVQAVLGPPTKTYGSSQWTYQRPLVFGFVNIHWRDDGTYDGEFNYERF